MSAALGGVYAAQAAMPAAGDGGPAVAAEHSTYTLLKLGILAGDELSIPFGINAQGDVVGYSGGLTMSPMPFRYTAATGKLKALPLPTGTTSGTAEDINDAGFVTGWVTHAPAEDEAVRWRPNNKSLCSARWAMPTTRATAPASTTTSR